MSSVREYRDRLSFRRRTRYPSTLLGQVLYNRRGVYRTLGASDGSVIHAPAVYGTRESIARAVIANAVRRYMSRARISREAVAAGFPPVPRGRAQPWRSLRRSERLRQIARTRARLSRRA